MDANSSPRLVSFAQSIWLLTLLCALPASATFLDEVVSNQVLTAQGSPYYATTNVLFHNPTIEPGVIILVTGGYELTLDGVVQITGSADAPILIKSATHGVPWHGLVITNAAAESQMAFCQIEGSDRSGIRIFSSPLIIRSCVVANNSSAQGGGINTDSSLRLEGCTITNNVITGTFCFGGGVRSTAGLLRLLGGSIAYNRIETTGWPCQSYGAGVYCSGRVEVSEGCQVTDNLAYAHGNDGAAHGGGIWADQAVAVTNSLIARNEARSYGDNHGPNPFGGGIFCNGIVTFYQSELSDNNAANVNSGAARGGGVFCQSINALKSVFKGNATTANYDYNSVGGAVFATTLVNLFNCLVIQNRTVGATWAQAGSAVFGGDPGSTIENCTIAGNTQSRSTWLGALMQFNGTIRNSILHGNSGVFFNGSPTVTYSLVEGGHAGTGNIDTDPLFVDNINYHLSTNSPAIDQGNPDSPFNDALVPPSLGSVRNDMGAYGGPGTGLVLGFVPPLLINSQPASQIVSVESTVAFSVGAAGGSGPIQYQWRFNGVRIGDETNRTLTLTNVTLTQAGIYSVSVSNLGVTLNSTNAALSVTQLKMYAGLTISGIVGANYRIDYTTNFQFNGWTVLTNLVLPSSPHLFIDAGSADSSGRVYRFVQLP